MADRRCPFCEYKGGGLFGASYRCKKTGDDIRTGSPIEENYCNNYQDNWSQCPYFRPQEKNK